MMVATDKQLWRGLCVILLTSARFGHYSVCGVLAQVSSQTKSGDAAAPETGLPYSANSVGVLPDQNPLGAVIPHSYPTSGNGQLADGPVSVESTFHSLTGVSSRKDLNGTTNSTSTGPVFQDVFNLRNASSGTNAGPNSVKFPFTKGGGKLLDPPNRSAVWRLRMSYARAPVDTTDDQLNCGAGWMPLLFRDGDEPECGVCGDALFGPQDNVIGGRYVSFPPRVSRSYDVARSRTIPVVFYLNHTVIPGFDTVTFGLCPIRNRYSDVTWDCAAEDGLLQIEQWGSMYYPSGPGLHTLLLQIPVNLTCSHCVLQWHWTTSVLADRAYCKSHPLLRVCYSPVEYVNCADVNIRDSNRRRSSSQGRYAQMSSGLV